MRFAVLRHGWFATFTGAVGVVGLGTEFQRLAVPLLVLDATHSVGAVAILRIAGFLPFILWGPFAGALIDRLDRRKVMLTCDVGQSVAYALMAAVVVSGFALWEIYALEFLASAFEVTWALVTDFSVVPSLVEDEELTQANALYLGMDRLVRTIGPALAGVLIATVGAAPALTLTAASFLATAGVILVMPARYRLEEHHGPFHLKALGSEIAEGFAYILRHRVLRALLVLMFVANVGSAGLQTVMLFYLREQVGLDPTAIGFALSVAGAAALVGSLAAPAIARGRPLGHSMLRVVAAAGVANVVAAVAGDWRLVVTAFSGRMFAQAAHIVYVFLPRQREIPRHLSGRGNSAFRMLLIIGNALSPALLSTLVDRAGTPAAFAFASALSFLAAGITYFSPLRDYDIRPVRDEPPAAAEEVEAAAE